MTEVLLFHHAHGQTSGFLDFAERLRSAGHTVHTPDLYDGRTYDDLDEGVAFADEHFAELAARAQAAAADLPDRLVYAGMSLGSMHAQLLTQTRPGARGALLLHGCLPPAEFGAWPEGVPAQIHTMREDPWVALDVVDAFVSEIAQAEAFLYPGSGHAFADSSLSDYDEAAATLLTDRVLEFLARLA